MDCSKIPQIRYSEFSKQLHTKVIKERIPIGGTIEITHRCNLNCVHCYCNHDTTKTEMSLKEICGILDEITNAGCLWLLLTGGEPLLREDFLDIYTYAKKKGMIITLFTNGTLITPYVADYLKDYPPFVIEISLYGARKETYEEITGVSGSFERCIQGINLLRERKLPLKLKTMAMTLNQDEVLDIESFARKRGLKFRFDAAINPKLDGFKGPCAFRISPEKIVELDMASEERATEWREFCKEFWGPPNSDNLYVCSAGIGSFNIGPYGDLTVCEMARVPGFNLRKNSFREYWYNAISKVLSQKHAGNYRCASCDLFSLCGQCPGWSYLENGNYQEPVEYLCRIAHLRAQALGLEEKESAAQNRKPQEAYIL